MASSFGSDEPATNPSAEALSARAAALDAAFGAAEATLLECFSLRSGQ